jgi:heat shock protein beta
MKPGQKTIYYLAGESREALEKSPFLERLLAKDLEVIYFTDPIDEYTMQNLTEFDEYKFSNASKEDLKFGDADDAEKKRNKKIREMFKDFTKWWKDVLPSDEVENVKISNRLVTTPCSVVTSKYGWSANMERIMKAQALSDDSRASYMRGKKTLEINPRHPLIKTLRERSIEDPESEETKELATVLYETAMLESGFAFDQPADFAGRLFSLVRKNMGIDENAEVDAEDADIEDEEEAAEDAEKGKDEL